MKPASMGYRPAPVIMLHGFTGNAANWNDISARLARQHHVIAPDIIGHGKNNSPADVASYSVEHMAREIIQLTDVPFYLLGYSMGARLALHIATHYPVRVRSLILESASPGLKTEAEREDRRKADNELADKIEANGVEWFVDYWESLPIWDSQKRLPEDVRLRLREQRLQNSPVGLANSLRGMGTGVMPSLWDRLQYLNMPVKLVVGEVDSKFVAINQEMAHVIHHANLSIVEGAGHCVHLEKLDEYTRLVLEFLDKHL